MPQVDMKCATYPVHNKDLDRFPENYRMKVMPPQFSPLKPIYPLTLTQGWGIYDPMDYSQFGFTRPNGVDVEMAPDGLVRAPTMA